MFTRDDLINAIGRMMTDIENGVWSTADGCLHEAITPLLGQLPRPGQSVTRPLYGNVPAAVLDPPKSAAAVDSGHPDLIDRDGDRWTWSEVHQRYVVMFRGTTLTQEDVDKTYGPVREVGPDGK